MATNFFENFPRLAYTLDDGDSEQVVVDIFKRAILSKEFLDNNSYFELYEVLEGETPEQFAYRYYGTEDLHWLVLLVNDISDPRFDWPMSSANLYKHIVGKYGTDQDVFTINKAVNAKGQQLETFFILLENSTHKKPKRLLIDSAETEQINTPLAYQDAAPGSEFLSNYEVELEKNELYRIVRVLKPTAVQDIVTNYNNIINQ